MSSKRLRKEPQNYDEFVHTIAALVEQPPDELANPDAMEAALIKLGRQDGTYYLYLARRSQTIYLELTTQAAAGKGCDDGASSSLSTARALLCDLHMFLTEDGDLLVHTRSCAGNCNLFDGTGPGGEARRARLAAILWDSPKTQSRLAALLDETPSRWLLSLEIPVIQRRRSALLGDSHDSYMTGADSRQFAFEQGYSGIGFSGGGIRSATFNLGVLQALAEVGLLYRFDYLASVSGGGYIHQWFAAWLRRATDLEMKRGALQGATPQDSICHAKRFVENALIAQPFRGKTSVSPPEISFLRSYSNYLTPRTGLFTLDTWTLIVTWLRNTLLNQLMIIAWLVAAISFARIVLLLAATAPKGWMVVPLWTICGLMYVAAWIGINLHFRAVDRPARNVASKQRFLQASIWLLLGSAFLWTYLILHGDVEQNFPRSQVNIASLATGAAIFLTILSLQISSGTQAIFDKMVRRASESETPVKASVLFQKASYFILLAIAALVLAAISSAGLAALRDHFAYHVSTSSVATATARVPVMSHLSDKIATYSSKWQALTNDPTARPVMQSEMRYREILVLAGPPILLTLIFLAILLHHGLEGRFFSKLKREWMARLRAAVGLAIAAYLAVGALAIFAPMLVNYAWGFRLKLISSLWALVSGSGVFAGNSSKTSGAHKGKISFTGVSLNVIAIAGGYLFILGYLVLLAELVEWLGPTGQSYLYLVLTFFIALAVGLIYGTRLDINEFSMHAFYRNRLARCYLGASTHCRNPEPFTGMDPRDTKIRLAELNPDTNYPGPFPIFCATANISTGEDLAWQARKGASFAFTPLTCGYDIPWQGPDAKTSEYISGQPLNYNGFRATADFGSSKGPSLSTVTAISGAAASPNMGFHTSLATAFLLTCANVRLGWWMRNTRLRNVSWGRDRQPFYSSPRFPARYLLLELLGKTSAKAQFLNLTDGGHFDNMGLYELVRRRCSFIVICDAEADSGCTFGGIASTIQHCRSDFGVEINLNLNEMLQPNQPPGTHKFAKSFTRGSIQYPEQREKGEIVYIKASITGKEGGDLQSYAKLHPNFPDDSTADQWFNEAKFESYRLLGRSIALEALGSAADEPRPDYEVDFRLSGRCKVTVSTQPSK